MTKSVTRQKAILFLSKAMLQMYIPGKPNILVFAIPTAVSHDIEILNKDELEKQLEAFVKANAIPPMDMIFILAAETLFEKDFVPANPEEQKHFLDAVPFENVSSKVYPNAQGVHVIAANEDFYSVFKEYFENQDSLTYAVVPYLAISPQMNALDQSTISAVLAQGDKIKLQSFIETAREEDFKPVTKAVVHEQEKKKRTLKETYTLVGVFALLLGVLGFMIFRPQPKETNVKAAAPKVSVTLPAVVPSAPPVSASPPLALTASPEAAITPAKATVKVQITYDSSAAAQAQALRQHLLEAGYTQVSLQDGGSISAAAPTAIFSPNLAPDLKAGLIEEVRKDLPLVTTTDANTGAVDVLITIPH